MGKAASPKFVPGVHTGKISAEKVATARDAWVRYVASKFPDKDVAAVCSYTFTANDKQ